MHVDLVWLLSRGQIPPKKRVVLGPEEAIARPYISPFDNPQPATLRPVLESWRARGKPLFAKGEKITGERWKEVMLPPPDPQAAMVNLGPFSQRHKLHRALDPDRDEKQRQWRRDIRAIGREMRPIRKVRDGQAKIRRRGQRAQEKARKKAAELRAEG